MGSGRATDRGRATRKSLAADVMSAKRKNDTTDGGSRVATSYRSTQKSKGVDPVERNDAPNHGNGVVNVVGQGLIAGALIKDLVSSSQEDPGKPSKTAPNPTQLFKPAPVLWGEA